MSPLLYFISAFPILKSIITPISIKIEGSKFHGCITLRRNMKAGFIELGFAIGDDTGRGTTVHPDSPAEKRRCIVPTDRVRCPLCRVKIELNKTRDTDWTGRISFLRADLTRSPL